MTEKRSRGRPRTGARQWEQVNCRFPPSIMLVIRRIAEVEGLTVTATVQKLALDQIADAHYIHTKPR